MQAAKPEHRSESLDTLSANTYAVTTQRSRDSRWKLWTTLAEAWDLDPLPLSVRLVSAIGACLRAGGYKSAKQTFCQARQEHIAETKTAVPPEVLLKMTQVERAVKRGRGPSKLKDSLFVEDIARLPPPHRTPMTSMDHMRGHAGYNIESTWSSSVVGGSSEASRPPR